MKFEQITEFQNVKYVQYGALAATGLVEHGFMTRIGGVSEGCFSSMNLGFTRGDDPAAVAENFRRAAACFHTTPDRIVTGQQTHTKNVRVVTEADAGKGVTKPLDFADVDGLVTNVPDLLLCTSHADCTPVFLVDPVKKAIGMTHSGWKGTVQCICRETVETMQRAYGTDPADLIAVIGPCNCGKCYEIGEDVAEQFIALFGDAAFNERFDDAAFNERCGDAAFKAVLTRRFDPETGAFTGKYLLDQKEANKRILMAAGVPEAQIEISKLCTFERDDLFFSHRKMGTKRGTMVAFLGLKAEA